eukprot:2229621-Rhodomonas_salina.2
MVVQYSVQLQLDQGTASCLRACYAMSGTDRVRSGTDTACVPTRMARYGVYGAVVPPECSTEPPSRSIPLRPRYAMSGTAIAYGCTRCARSA